MKQIVLLLTLVISSAVYAVDIKYSKGVLEYTFDERGNRVLDFSYCGYAKSEKPIPDFDFVNIRTKKDRIQSNQGLKLNMQAIRVPISNSIDYTAQIQSAIDRIESLALDANGFRGAVLLDEGQYTISSSLFIRKSGVVLRGSGKSKTSLHKVGVDRFPFVRIEGDGNMIFQDSSSVENQYLPVNSRNLKIPAHHFKVGDELLIERPSTKEWIARLACADFGGGLGYWGWKEGDADLDWTRTVVAVSPDVVTFDAPLTMAIDQSEGKLLVMSFKWWGRVQNCGVENLTLVSSYDSTNKKDEDHAWTGISIDNARDCWVRQVDFKHLAGSAVVLQPSSSRITVEDCVSYNPVSEIGGMRRQTFMTFGQLNLFQRCYSEEGLHDFVAGYGAPGPNAFVQCESHNSFGYSGSVDLWAPGLLFDIVNIDGNALSFKNLGIQRQGAGWNTANSMLWQCTASEIECFTPDTDNPNRAYGCWGMLSGNGEWADANNHIYPRSLYYAQLSDRLVGDHSKLSRLLVIDTDATSSPTVEQAQELTAAAKLPKLTLKLWINQSPSLNSDFNRILSYVPIVNNQNRKITPKVQIESGILVQDGKLLVGSKKEAAWWNGKLRPRNIQSASAHITRFVPDRFGKGLTDNVDSVTSEFKASGVLMFDHHYSLWYDRRRDDHERIRRKDGDVWGPFYEQAFARSGSDDTAWDGLSLYDLKKPNKWYWSRLRQFAANAERKGVLLNEQHFFQHNILEAGAHYVDSPWRTINNVNDMGLPEPVNFAGDKRIFYAEMFYDLSHPARKEAFRNYIRTCLDSLSDYSNVIHSISDEYTGPLHFVEFWLDVIDEWQKEKSKNVVVSLAVTKDVQDSILMDPKRSGLVDIIDIRYWHPRNDGTVYAPQGGLNMAPRQFARKMKVGKTEFKDVYQSVIDYRMRFPEKAVCYYAQSYPQLAWAVAMAGGSCAQLPVKDISFLTAMAKAKPQLVKSDKYVQMVKNGTDNIIFSHNKQEVRIGLIKGYYDVNYINPIDGDIKVISRRVKVEDSLSLDMEKGVYWVTKI